MSYLDDVEARLTNAIENGDISEQEARDLFQEAEAEGSIG